MRQQFKSVTVELSRWSFRSRGTPLLQGGAGAPCKLQEGVQGQPTTRQRSDHLSRSQRQPPTQASGSQEVPPSRTHSAAGRGGPQTDGLLQFPHL